MSLLAALIWLGWFGDVMALTGSYFIGGGKLRLGWKCFLVADISLIGLPLYLRAWNLAFLYAAFLVLGIRGILKSKESASV